MNVIELKKTVSKLDSANYSLPGPKVDLKKRHNVSEKNIELAKESANKMLGVIHKHKILSGMERNMILGETVVQNERMIYRKMQESLEKVGLIVEDINVALEKYPILEDYFFEQFKIEDNALTVHHAQNWTTGIFVWAKKGAKFSAPVHAFFLVNESLFAQAPHTVILLEEESEVHLVEGCTAPIVSRDSLHVGGGEIYLKKGAKLFVTKLQNWPKYIDTRPLTYATLEDGAELHFVNIILGGGNSTYENPKIYLKGKNAKVVVHEIILGLNNAVVDLGTTIYHQAEETSSEITSKALGMQDSNLTTRGVIKAEVKNVKGHISCDTLILNNAKSEAYPGLSTNVNDVMLSHEASIGKIADTELNYLMSRGFTRAEATELVVKGFVAPSLKDVPKEFQTEVNNILEMAAKSVNPL